MTIDDIVCPTQIEDKLECKHQVSLPEVRQVLLNQPRIRFAERGYVEGEDVYAAFGRTLRGRYLAVFFVYKPISKTVIVISAREMSHAERKRYGRK